MVTRLYLTLSTFPESGKGPADNVPVTGPYLFDIPVLWPLPQHIRNGRGNDAMSFR